MDSRLRGKDRPEYLQLIIDHNEKYLSVKYMSSVEKNIVPNIKWVLKSIYPGKSATDWILPKANVMFVYQIVPESCIKYHHCRLT